MPTDSELSDYATRLPKIYRDILSAYPVVEPGRKAGFGLAVQTLAMHFYNRRMEYSLGEIQEACRRLAELGFVEIKNGIFAHPTELGERLIAVLTDKRAPALTIPDLPPPSWK